MKTIKEVDVEDSHLIIKHENGYLQFYPYHDYERINPQIEIPFLSRKVLF